ncbi:DODA-type extradiol aromatic ring-opening family dioxygenase [Alteromonas halophila]|uniref:Dioxygenase n=1 Tax=Alteromonas halophila TaxID=516698 RepID=A0A918JPB6_9ALTE|nr:class III extradiol ring-cleavage dioxygenase [Alteromonas halophila]GGW90021.1 dioxygenase [Alteromonas halophila]
MDTPTFSHHVVYLSHGGGPLPLLGDAAHQQMTEKLSQLAVSIPRPEAILVVSAHWEDTVINVSASSSPELLFDYYGFAQQAYQIRYPCKGSAELTSQVLMALKSAGIEARSDATRGLDHGVFVPLKIMYPAADIPVVALSLHSQLSPRLHIEVGKALGRLRGNLLVIGSGFSFHNMQAFSVSGGDADARNQRFQRWLHDTIMNKTYSEKVRQMQLTDWTQAPNARYCHPREEHLLPLHVCYGVAGRMADKAIKMNVLGVECQNFIWYSR